MCVLEEIASNCKPVADCQVLMEQASSLGDDGWKHEVKEHCLMVLGGFLLWEKWGCLLWVEAAIPSSQHCPSGVCREQPALCPCAAGSAPQWLLSA